MAAQTALRFNPRFPEPSPETQRLILLSFEEASAKGSRVMRCPVCGFKVTDVPLTQTEPVYIRCGKCKFQGALSPAYFRRMKRYHDSICSLYGSSIRSKRIR